MKRNTRFDKYIQEYKGKFYIAEWKDKAGQFVGVLRGDIQRLTGCSGFYCKSEKGLPGAGGYVYSSRKSALRRCRELNEIYGME